MTILTIKIIIYKKGKEKYTEKEATKLVDNIKTVIKQYIHHINQLSYHIISTSIYEYGDYMLIVIGQELGALVKTEMTELYVSINIDAVATRPAIDITEDIRNYIKTKSNEYEEPIITIRLTDCH